MTSLVHADRWIFSDDSVARYNEAMAREYSKDPVVRFVRYLEVKERFEKSQPLKWGYGWCPIVNTDGRGKEWDGCFLQAFGTLWGGLSCYGRLADSENKRLATPLEFLIWALNAGPLTTIASNGAEVLKVILSKITSNDQEQMKKFQDVINVITSLPATLSGAGLVDLVEKGAMVLLGISFDNMHDIDRISRYVNALTGGDTQRAKRIMAQIRK